VNAFKERLDKHWKEYCFRLDPEDFILSGLMSRAEDQGKGKGKGKGKTVQS